MELWELSASEIAMRVKAKEVSAQEVLDAHLARISEVDPRLCAFLEVLEPEARIDASRVDAKIARRRRPRSVGRRALCSEGQHEPQGYRLYLRL